MRLLEKPNMASLFADQRVWRYGDSTRENGRIVSRAGRFWVLVRVDAVRWRVLSRSHFLFYEAVTAMREAYGRHWGIT